MIITAHRPLLTPVHAVFPSRRGLLPAVRELIDFLALEFAKRALAERSDEPAPAGVPLGVSAKGSSKKAG